MSRIIEVVYIFIATAIVLVSLFFLTQYQEQETLQQQFDEVQITAFNLYQDIRLAVSEPIGTRTQIDIDVLTDINDDVLVETDPNSGDTVEYLLDTYVQGEPCQGENEIVTLVGGVAICCGECPVDVQLDFPEDVMCSLGSQTNWRSCDSFYPAVLHSIAVSCADDGATASLIDSYDRVLITTPPAARWGEYLIFDLRKYLDVGVYELSLTCGATEVQRIAVRAPTFGGGGVGSSPSNTNEEEPENYEIVANFSVSLSSGNVSLPVLFNASTSTTELDIFYSWDFEGDGIEDAAGIHANHTYIYPGTYTALLTVSNSLGGSDTQTEVIEVYDNKYNSSCEQRGYAPPIVFTPSSHGSGDGTSFGMRLSDYINSTDVGTAVYFGKRIQPLIDQFGPVDLLFSRPWGAYPGASIDGTSSFAFNAWTLALENELTFFTDDWVQVYRDAMQRGDVCRLYLYLGRPEEQHEDTWQDDLAPAYDIGMNDRVHLIFDAASGTEEGSMAWNIYDTLHQQGFEVGVEAIPRATNAHLLRFDSYGIDRYYSGNQSTEDEPAVQRWDDELGWIHPASNPVPRFLPSMHKEMGTKQWWSWMGPGRHRFDNVYDAMFWSASRQQLGFYFAIGNFIEFMNEENAFLLWSTICPHCVENERPQAYFVAEPQSGLAPLDVSFDASGSTDDESTLTYAWDFENDGVVDATGVNVEHTFVLANPQGYLVTLTVSDGDFTDTYQSLVVVNSDIIVPICDPEVIDC